jgi:quercetin dioxygenase-like cupin family protein
MWMIILQQRFWRNIVVKQTIEKGWGREVIFADHPEYCGKLLIYDKEGATSSMHFHKDKKESWYVLSGSFLYKTIDTDTGKINTSVIVEGDTCTNYPFTIHQLIAVENNSVIIEVSTQDSMKDNFRVLPGDGQNEISG